jgi:catechol 2,3-dioxygenase-like lactoylglutathione lyase family enzyme
MTHLILDRMLHHVGIEVAPADIERSVELWQALGFALVEPPESLAEFTWLERDGTQVHLMPTESPTVPPRGHVAVVVADFDRTLTILAEAGFEIDRRREHWGAPRAVIFAPAGHGVELIAAPPRSA